LTAHANFGRNQRWRARTYRPANEAEVLDILRRHAGGRVRAIGSGHSWSDAAVSDDIALDLSRFDQIHLHENLVRAGAGCRLQRLLNVLRHWQGRTLPTLGAIKRQTLSGAISTGTHGSGMPGLSHFVAAVRVAAYDPASGEPRIFEHRDGEALRAARCAVGCAGIILSADLPTVPLYQVRETVLHVAKLDDVLARIRDCPLTQFAFLPFRWDHMVFERKPVERRRLSPVEWMRALFFRLYHFFWVDLLAHLLVKLTLVTGPRSQILFQKLTPRAALKNCARLDDAEQVLTLGHHYFRHEEMELFVPAARLAEALELLRRETEAFAGRGEHTQHYPFLVRRVLPEDTLISMAAAEREPWYSISVFTYHPPRRRAGYYAFCAALARAMHAAFGARLHWGKHFPLGAAEMERVVPALGRFRELCAAADPRGVFRNRFAERSLGFPRAV
jgi:L-gulono-1,4-lactone dehydrogenase